MNTIKLGRFSPLGNLVVSQTGISLELGTPIFNARFATDKVVAAPQDIILGNSLPNAVPFSALQGAHWELDSFLHTLFHLNVPLAPASLLLETAEFFRSIMQIGGKMSLDEDAVLKNSASSDRLVQAEGLVWLTYTEEDGWGLKKPAQNISAAAVRAEGIRPEDNVAIEIHSHGRLPAYFSATDNNNENEGFIYGVLGNLDADQTSFVFRVGYAGYFLEVTPVELFDAKEVQFEDDLSA